MRTTAQKPQTTVPDERAGLTVEQIKDEISRRIDLYRSTLGNVYRDRAEALEGLRSWIVRAGR